MAEARIETVLGDITEQDTEAIVNAANTSLLGGGGVDGAIHRAGGPEILGQCRRLRAERYPDGLPTGGAVATGAGRLRARWVIHAVGPVFSASEDRTALLEGAYRSSLAVAEELGARSVAFPAISAGVYRWPMTEAAETAVRTVRDTLAGRGGPIRLVRFVLFSRTALEAFTGAVRAGRRHPDEGAGPGEGTTP